MKIRGVGGGLSCCRAHPSLQLLIAQDRAHSCNRGAVVAMADEPAAEEAPPTEAVPEEVLPEPQVSKSRDPNRTILYRHWSRPTTLQYNYIYDYRHNYYNDVIDYLDRKTKGLNRDIPRAQTWAERVLRTYTKDTKSAAFQSRHRDLELLNSIRASNSFYRLHNKDYLVKRYPALGY